MLAIPTLFHAAAVVESAAVRRAIAIVSPIALAFITDVLTNAAGAAKNRLDNEHYEHLCDAIEEWQDSCVPRNRGRRDLDS